MISMTTLLLNAVAIFMVITAIGFFFAYRERKKRSQKERLLAGTEHEREVERLVRIVLADAHRGTPSSRGQEVAGHPAAW